MTGPWGTRGTGSQPRSTRDLLVILAGQDAFMMVANIFLRLDLGLEVMGHEEREEGIYVERI